MHAWHVYMVHVYTQDEPLKVKMQRFGVRLESRAVKRKIKRVNTAWVLWNTEYWNGWFCIAKCTCTFSLSLSSSPSSLHTHTHIQLQSKFPVSSQGAGLQLQSADQYGVLLADSESSDVEEEEPLLPTFPKSFDMTTTPHVHISVINTPCTVEYILSINSLIHVYVGGITSSVFSTRAWGRLTTLWLWACQQTSE